MSSRVFATPKGQQIPAPNMVRPITVLSQIYRIWAQVICRQILIAFGRSMTCDITGLPGRGVFEAAYTSQWFFEQAQSSVKIAQVSLLILSSALMPSTGLGVLAFLLVLVCRIPFSTCGLSHCLS